ncbi:MAG: hypothetical protein AAGH53_07215 [Pseudomonadota bacterium]
MRDSFVKTMLALMAEDPDVILLTGDLGFGIFNQFEADFPDRYINVGVAEQNMLGLAAGLSLMGKKVFCYSIANFSFMRGLEQFRNGAIYHNTNVTVVCSGGGFTYGQLGFTHFAIEDYGILSTFPGLQIHHPATSEQVVSAVKDCAIHNGPCYLRLEKLEMSCPALKPDLEKQGLYCHTDKGNVALVAIGSLLDLAIKAVEGRDQDVAVYSLVRHDLITNETILDELAKFSKILVIEEHVMPNSAGQKLRAALPQVEFNQFAINDGGPSIVGDQHFLRGQYGLTSEAIRSAL